MMKKLIYPFFCLCICFLSCDDDTIGCTDIKACNFDTSADSNDGSCEYICLSEEEKARVIDLVQSAKLYWTINGQQMAFEVFDVPSQTFIDDELYVFVLDDTGFMDAHGSSAILIGTNQYELQDVNGKEIVVAVIEAVNNTEGKGWVCYQWEDPLTNTIRKKFTYVEKFYGFIIGSGTYK